MIGEHGQLHGGQLRHDVWETAATQLGRTTAAGRRRFRRERRSQRLSHVLKHFPPCSVALMYLNRVSHAADPLGKPARAPGDASIRGGSLGFLDYFVEQVATRRKKCGNGHVKR